MVATPIGNLEDVTLRALRVLREAELVLAEDTRRTRVLLDRHGIAARPLSLHAHNEAARIARVLDTLAGGGPRRAGVRRRNAARLGSGRAAGGRGDRSRSRGRSRARPFGGARGARASRACRRRASRSPASCRARAGERDAWLRRLARAPGDARAVRVAAARGRDARAHARSCSATGRACVARELTKLHEEVARGTLLALAESSRQARGERSRSSSAGARGRPRRAPTRIWMPPGRLRGTTH